MPLVACVIIVVTTYVDFYSALFSLSCSKVLYQFTQ